MERRSFLKKSALATGAVVSATNLKAGTPSAVEKDIYELRVYHLKSGGSRNQLKKFYTEAVIPFLNERGAKVGAFNEYSKEDPPVMYTLHAHKSLAAYFDAVQDMRTDAAFLKAAKDYMSLPADNPVFDRYETFLLEAFDGIPRLKEPAKNRGLFELRTYESYNEDAGVRKVKMFNDEELPLFEKVGLHSVFFGQHLAGQYMPALTYMLWFADMEEREANWAKFVGSAEWNAMKDKPEYANTVSKVKKRFLIPADFSQL
ncbi:NIPSNAP family protein [Maribellus sp. YY47]|uniref:NIPSNAP family protein n=1 Tax=Maribellus sp. YY47 TaxID=2929486 RepID=UPI0020014440|nr:NIPSNAP family protein [Maribellus sp. YY47]MCK3682477.1 NIPSNAP family protein [Maribellus sp. YY47]